MTKNEYREVNAVLVFLAADGREWQAREIASRGAALYPDRNRPAYEESPGSWAYWAATTYPAFVVRGGL